MFQMQNVDELRDAASPNDHVEVAKIVTDLA